MKNIWGKKVNRKSFWVAIAVLMFTGAILLVSRWIAPTRFAPQLLNKAWHRFDTSVPLRFAHPDHDMIQKVEKMFKVQVSPSVEYTYAIFENGVLQSINMPFTYDYIPRAIRGGYLFQGFHEYPLGTALKLTAKMPGRLFFIFHRESNGGYDRIFPTLTRWTRADDAPKYDIHHGDHGWHMVMYELKTEGGTYTIPPTTQADACFSIVFVPDDTRLSRTRK